MMSESPPAPSPFAGPRKIAPFDMPQNPDPNAAEQERRRCADEKAAGLNQHVIGYGDLVENEWAALALAAPDLDAMRRYRLERVREQLRERDLAGALLYDPLNIRYATDSTNMQVWSMHNASRYVWVSTQGPVVLWDYHNCEHLSHHLDLVNEIRQGTAWYFFASGNRIEEMTRRWAAEIADLVSQHGGGNRRIAVDRINPEGVVALGRHDVSVVNAEGVLEHARAIKSPDEIRAIRRSIAACEAAMGAMQRSLRPGMTENDLWAILHAENIRRGGEWIETRLLASGPRTNPWFQESSARVIGAGDIVAFDTDLIGPYGYCSDISRAWLAGDRSPSSEQRFIFAMAQEQIATNMALLKPGTTFRELSQSAYLLPPDCRPNRYSVLFHGVGLCDEYPSIVYPEDWESSGYDGVLKSGMVVCVESYVGRHGGHEGVKLEEQVLITETGHECLSRYPLDERLTSTR